MLMLCAPGLGVLQASPVHLDAISRSQAANMLSFRYPGGQYVSILVSKSGGRYRLQSSCLEAMWLVLQVRTHPVTGQVWVQLLRLPACAPSMDALSMIQKAAQTCMCLTGRRQRNTTKLIVAPLLFASVLRS